MSRVLHPEGDNLPPGAADPKARSQHAADELPRAFGPYLLFDRIGRGGMADIFLAREATELGGGRRVVIKEVLGKLSADEAFAEMLVHEAKVSAQLRHQNIVQVRDLGREAGRLFIAMDYVEGYDLNDLLKQLSARRLPLPAQFAMLILRGVLAALDYAHRAVDTRGLPLGVVHRDVSPSNILISFDGEVRLCDFGIARAFDMGGDAGGARLDDQGHADVSQSQPGLRAGKSAYMAPEHARGEDPDPRSDVFAAAIVAWELCAGRRLHRGTEAEMLEKARAGQVPPLPAGRLPNQEGLQAILDHALQVDPAARYQTAGEMLRDLEEYALGVRLMASELRFADFLTEHFADEMRGLRRSREQAAELGLQQNSVAQSELEPTPAASQPPPVPTPPASSEPVPAPSLPPKPTPAASRPSPAPAMPPMPPVPNPPAEGSAPVVAVSQEPVAAGGGDGPTDPASVGTKRPGWRLGASSWMWIGLTFLLFCVTLGGWLWMLFQD